LIANADVFHSKMVRGRELEETRRQLCPGPAAQVTLDVRRQDFDAGFVLLAAELLFFDPTTLAFGEGGRRASRTPARNRDADGAIICHSNQIPPCTWVSDEDTGEVKRERRLTDTGRRPRGPE
jgi:hypothetical protein